jgi:predicted Zn-dependent protease
MSLKLSRFVAVFFVIGSGCATSPTGRSQLMIVGDGQMNQMGLQSFDQLKHDTPIERDPAINAYVKCIVDPITKYASDRTGIKDWEIVVFKSPEVNAFALPGGKIGVYSGILPVTKNAAQLAAVLGHETGHVIAKHGAERVSQGILAQGLTTAVGVGFQNKAYQPLILAGLGIGAQYGYLLPHSREQESEADLIGVDLMAIAGFDPRESVELWKNMTAASAGKAPSEWMSTHPSNENRITALQAAIPAALPKDEAAVKAGRAPNCARPAGL